MAALPDLEEWLQDANEALSISLIAPSAYPSEPSKRGLQTIATFHPKFTYSIFGEDEKIFGYQDLKLHLRCRANDMRPHLRISYKSKLKPTGDAEPLDIVELLEGGQHLPKVAFVSGSDFDNSCQQLGDNWSPPGKLHSAVHEPDGDYEIWEGSLADPAVRQLNSRIQIFVPLFIEGGSYIGSDPEGESDELDLSDADRWTCFFLYRRQSSATDAGKSAYTFMGYATVYRFFHFRAPTPPASPAGAEWELPRGDTDFAEFSCRSRISQFLVLPPFQGKGRGALLYRTVFGHYHGHEQTYEVTVENPNEAFDDLRDACDLAFLRTMPEFAALCLDTDVVVPKTGPVPRLIVGQERLEEIRLRAKIAPRQFARVLEMHLMSQLPESVRPSMALEAEVPAPTKRDRHQERLWQLVVKQRLYRHNKDVLSQIDVDERITKLSETLGSVELEYARLLAAAKRAAEHGKHEPATESGANGKRRLEESPSKESSKKARTEDV